MIGKRANYFVLLPRIFVVPPRVQWIVGLKVSRMNNREEGEGVTFLVKKLSGVGKERGGVPCMKVRKYGRTEVRKCGSSELRYRLDVETKCVRCDDHKSE